MSEFLVTIITPVFNAKEYIEETILSVLEQTYRNIQYVVIDGGSTDGTLEIIQKYQDQINIIISESDAGMYDALVKGFSYIKGDIVAYINAGDLYHTKALSVVSDIFLNKEVTWLTGMSIQYNSMSQIIKVDQPGLFRQELIRCQCYGKYLPYIQQESTFWRRHLLDSIDKNKLRNFKLAGDAYLWNCFAKNNELHIANTFIAGFKHHDGQLSENNFKYDEEWKSFSEKLTLRLKVRLLLDRLLILLPLKFKKKINDKILIYDLKSKRWH